MLFQYRGKKWTVGGHEVIVRLQSETLDLILGKSDDSFKIAAKMLKGDIAVKYVLTVDRHNGMITRVDSESSTATAGIFDQFEIADNHEIVKFIYVVRNVAHVK